MCDVNIDDCESTPCANGGQCIDDVADYSCVCEQGYTGKNCQHKIDYCDSDPCQNGGTCSSKLLLYQTCSTFSLFLSYTSNVSFE